MNNRKYYTSIPFGCVRQRCGTGDGAADGYAAEGEEEEERRRGWWCSRADSGSEILV